MMPALTSAVLPPERNAWTAGVRHGGACVFHRQAEVAGPDELVLAHGDAAEDLVEIFAERGLDDQRLQVAHAAFRREPFAIARHLLERFDIGREPGQSVGRMLLALDRGRRQPAVFAHPVGDAPARLEIEAVGGLCRRAGQADQCVTGNACTGVTDRHGHTCKLQEKSFVLPGPYSMLRCNVKCGM